MLAGLRHRLRLGAKAASELGELGPTSRAKAVGKASPGKQLLTAPITNRSCVFYSVEIAEWSNGCKTPLLTETSTAVFRIADATGRALVDPERVQAFLKRSRVRGHSSDSLAQHRTLLKRHGFTMLDDYGELRSLAYSETIVAPDDRICVIGAVRQRSDPSGSASYREQPQQNVFGYDGESPLLLSEI